MNAFDLTGKTFLVTGASSGLGKQTAITISQYGGTLIITGRNEERLNDTLTKLEGKNHISIPADLTKQDDINNLVDKLPILNGVVYSTGISVLTPARFIKKENIEENFKISFEASVVLTSGILSKKKLEKKASLVFISSISTKYPFVGGALYISSKASMEAYSKVLALELAPRGIRSNCISPAFVKTPMLDNTEKSFSREVVDKIERMQPLGLGEPEDVANTIIYFLSDASRWVTGTNLILGGG